jgi:iron complex outermembrane receptor protein
MHIFGACTDKMDPITSYVDISNLSEIDISSGQNGATNGPTIGGAINLVRSTHDFCNPGWSGSLNFGFESNAKFFTTGAKVKYVHPKFFTEVDFIYRDADNYKGGKKTLVPFSQFSKYNISATAGVKLNEKNKLVGSFIFDKANNVGYPALPMDVSLARAIIASAEHTAENLNSFIEEWNTKIYVNTITHKMDDTKRPVVPIHMDMPGWSKTYGAYSKIKASKKNHSLDLNLNLYYNQSIAEMTMYPKDTTENKMFMYTWPDVRTIYFGFNFSDNIKWKKVHHFQYGASLGFNRNYIANEFGLNSLKIFYPEMKEGKNRLVAGANAGYIFEKNKFEIATGIGYGERAPSVSEGYGFYLFNSFDRYDYIGNPNLKNEKSLELNGSISYKTKKIKINLSTNYFHIFDFIIGIINSEYIPMTIGATGVREYKALKAVNISNVEFGIDYKPHSSWRTKARFTYSIGSDFNKEKLPLIKPFSFNVSLAYKIKTFDCELSVDGASKQYAFSKNYGEDKTPAYAILNFSAGYFLNIENHRLYLRAGVENIIDSYYSTFSDWNNIPRKGRNFYINITYAFEKLKK